MALVKSINHNVWDNEKIKGWINLYGFSDPGLGPIHMDSGHMDGLFSVTQRMSIETACAVAAGLIECCDALEAHATTHPTPETPALAEEPF